MEKEQVYIKITKDGPYIVYGIPKIAEEIITTDKDGISIKYTEGKSFEVKGMQTCLCRCGKSSNAPYCDGTHEAVSFDGEETASFDPIIKNAEAIKGPNYTLYDNENYCAFARFCDAGGRVWNLVSEGKPETDLLAIQEACNCPAGRLLMADKDGKIIEPYFPKSIGVIEDGGLKISGPLWIKGGIRVESIDGKSYEVRNRQTLCRCGRSSNKPFCNGAHASVKWKAQTPK
jgi:CDGSH-type Zn-finger protein